MSWVLRAVQTPKWYDALDTICFEDFAGDDYDLIGRPQMHRGMQKKGMQKKGMHSSQMVSALRRNCCTFARALVKKLGVSSVPKWVDRLVTQQRN